MARHHDSRCNAARRYRFVDMGAGVAFLACFCAQWDRGVGGGHHPSRDASPHRQSGKHQAAGGRGPDHQMVVAGGKNKDAHDLAALGSDARSHYCDQDASISGPAREAMAALSSTAVSYAAPSGVSCSVRLKKSIHEQQ